MAVDTYPTQAYADWLRLLARRAGIKGVVDNVDARALFRIAERLNELQRKED